jgi:bromodomain-containing protein 7/9
VARLHGVDDTLAEGPHATQAEIYMFLQTDFRLVVTNAKIFNPPGTIYHTEADRLEMWGLDHIAKASAHVIEYETDWNIDVEQDEDAALVIDEDDDHVTASTPREIEGSQIAASPAPSSVPQQYIKRGPRGPYKKGTSMGISEGIDAEGRLPGSKDGVGAFPPGSDWAEMMVALKIKGIVS